MEERPTVLVVDDDPSMLTLIAAVLESDGIDAVKCPDPLDAAPLASERQPGAIVLDLMMPGLSGFHVLELLRSQPSTRRIPILILSAKNEAADRIRGLKAGADDYLSKPFEPEELSIRLWRLIRGAREGSAAILSGRLGQLAVGDIIQQALISGSGGVLELEGSLPGAIAISQGAIVWARCGQLDGEAALIALLPRRAGHFRLVETPVEGTGGGEPLSLNGTLMRMAWLEDELERRRHLLPPPGTPFRAEESGDPPHDECEKAGMVLEWFRSHPGASLDELERAMFLAPQQARLATALLVESGLLHPEGLAPGGETPPAGASRESSIVRMDTVCSALAHQATAMGRPADILHVLVGVDPERWQAFLDELTEDVSATLVDQALEPILAELRNAGSASLRISCSRASLLLHIHQLSGLAGLRARAFLPMSMAVILCPSSGPHGQTAEIIEATRILDPSPQVLVIPPAAGPPAGFSIPSGWQVPEAMPSSLEELLELLIPD